MPRPITCPGCNLRCPAEGYTPGLNDDLHCPRCGACFDCCRWCDNDGRMMRFAWGARITSGGGAAGSVPQEGFGTVVSCPKCKGVSAYAVS